RALPDEGAGTAVLSGAVAGAHVYVAHVANGVIPSAAARRIVRGEAFTSRGEAASTRCARSVAELPYATLAMPGSCCCSLWKHRTFSGPRRLAVVSAPSRRSA